MSYDPRLIPFTGGHEGFVARWYRDPTGTPTIGYGFTWGSRVFRDWWMTRHGRKMQPGDMISKADAAAVLKALIDNEYAPPVEQRILDADARVTAHARAAAIDMAYNCGPGALGWKWFKALLAGEVGLAASRYRVTATTSKGRRLPGLIRRRNEGADILKHNRWPRGITAPASSNSNAAVVKSLSGWQLADDDFQQGLAWLKELGFYAGATGTIQRKHPSVMTAVLAFQRQHPQLANDGILGRATLDQIQRVIDVKRKAAKAGGAGAGGAAVGAGGDAVVQNPPALDWLFWGSLGFVVVAGAWLAWSYRDELKLAWASLRRRK